MQQHLIVVAAPEAVTTQLYEAYALFAAMQQQEKAGGMKNKGVSPEKPSD